MPYEFTPAPAGETRLQLWPYRSLSARGFVIFISLTSAALSLPLFGLIGRLHLWVMLPFLVAAIAGIWWAIMRSWRDGEIIETLHMSADLITLDRHGPRGRHQNWQANPYWARLTRHETGGPVPNYLTLRGQDGREVELGAFLSEEERRALHIELGLHLRSLR